MLKLKNAKKVFNPDTINEKVALKEIDLKMELGEFITVIGSNGAGKSTLLNAIAGNHQLTTGEIIIDGQNLTGVPDYDRAHLVSRVFQDPLQGTAASMTIAENLVLALRRSGKLNLSTGVTDKRREIFKDELSILNLGLEDRLDDKVGLLSGGQRQALTLVMATIQEPSILLLDEHTAALDPKTAEKIVNITKEIVSHHNLTTVMVTHDLDHALELGTRTIMMDNGRIVLDVEDEERRDMTIDDLLEKFAKVSGHELTNDRILLAQ
ncbi:ABC transporter ATP-binding protein [Halanaerobacter jeridensis]|uniref:ABC transport system ATP-binding protein n=1 Tax=Halanaerobacter jeridensis TaxID=706427 RepID=A0A938XTW1_9FIRM|nr:ATP-binding cassette domain-containing protein [Halanaerobacter jeridensis]MBM7555482.1 putative ABC transport system ATP-binding protein [Halanaerobacter jeridensis]